MSVSDEFIAISMALILLYAFLYTAKVRWHRIAGCIAIMIVGVAFGVIGDNIPMFVLAMINFIVAGLKLMEEIPAIIEDVK